MERCSMTIINFYATFLQQIKKEGKSCFDEIHYIDWDTADPINLYLWKKKK